MSSRSTLGRDLLIFTGGLALIFLANLPALDAAASWGSFIETIGIGLAAYAPIQIVLGMRDLASKTSRQMRIDRLFQASVQVVSEQEKPTFIATDIEGCITPANRAQVDMRRLQRIRSYCEFAKLHQDFPPIVLYTGRSQGYVELLAQCLGMIGAPMDLPFVIENGSALYRPTSRRTIVLVGDEQLEAVKAAQTLLSRELKDHAFEPKSYMVTVNPKPAQPVDDLREQVALLLERQELLSQVHLTNTASAVDITAAGVDKLSGLMEVLKYYPDERPLHDLTTIVAVGDHISDLPILSRIGRAYCPAENVDTEVRAFVERTFGPQHVLHAPPVDFVVEVIERETGVRVS